MTHQDRARLFEIGQNAIPELESDLGIMASSKGEVYGCIFGRDSLISALNLISAAEKGVSRDYYLPLAGKILRNLAKLQGTQVNIESGEGPGKIIHEYRPDRHEHLTRDHSPTWYLYPDSVMKNYDSIDSTLLFLMAAARYFRVADDAEAEAELMPHIMAALSWVLTSSDTNGDGFLDYRMHPDRTHGGLIVQSWMDSHESLFRDDGTAVVFPIAPVEAQAYGYHALLAWADRLGAHDPAHAGQLRRRADELKERFNKAFVIREEGIFSLAYAIDGAGVPLTAARSSMGHILWAAYGSENADSILEREYVPLLVGRLIASDLFDPRAGIRTLSTLSTHFDPKGYHNGSIWPHDTAMAIEGMEKFGYRSEARMVRDALAGAMLTAGTPIELLTIVDDAITHGQSESGQHACKVQAWSATALISEFAPEYSDSTLTDTPSEASVTEGV